MTKERMHRLLELYPGIGVVLDADTERETCYFYQDFESETDGIKRAMAQIYPLQAKGECKTIAFVSNEMARKAVAR